jgi:hypothetical protein
MKTKTIKWVGHIVGMEEKRYEDRVYVGNLKGSEEVHASIQSVCTLNICGGRELDSFLGNMRK